MAARLEPWFEAYAADHRNRGNEACHYAGVPLVALSVLGLLGPLGAGVVLAGAMAWYLYLDARLALLFLPAAAALYWLAGLCPRPAHAALFVLGWAFQLVGHLVYERGSPAFTKNPAFLLIGPLWVFARLLRLA